MQIFEITQRKKTNEISYNSLEQAAVAAAEKKSKSPNFARDTGPGVQPQTTVTPTMRTAAASPAPASDTAANFATGVGPGVQPQMTVTPTMAPAAAPAAAATPVVAPAPSTPGVRGSRTGAVVSALGSRLQDKLAADAGLSGVPDTGDNNAYGDQRTAARAAAAPLINQQARQEMAKWNQAVAKAVQQAGIQVEPKVRKEQPLTGMAQLPEATKQALQRSLMSQVYSNFLQSTLGQNYKQLPQWVDADAQKEAAAQIAKLDNAIKGILNFTAPVGDADTQMQLWQDLSQATYDMRSLLKFQPKEQDNARTPRIARDATGVLYIGQTPIDTTTKLGSEIEYAIDSETLNGILPKIKMTPTGAYMLGQQELDPTDSVEKAIIEIIKTQPGIRS